MFVSMGRQNLSAFDLRYFRPNSHGSRREMAGLYAYAIIRTTFSAKKKGESVRDRGSMSVALHKGADGWRIAAWAWADD
jgi:hypothetical protein